MIIVTNENVNGIIDYSVSMVESIIKDRKYPGKLKNGMYLIFASYLIEYGYERIKEIYETFNSTQFTFTNIPLIEYIKSRDDLLSYIKNNKLLFESAPAITCTKLGGVLENPKFYDEIIISGDMNIDLLGWIEVLAHEINHLFTSQKGRIFLVDDKLFVRNGLQTTEMYGKETIERGRTFNECINSLQTESLIQNIVDLCGLKIDNKFVSSTLENIKYGSNKRYKAIGYEELLPIYRELYNNQYFQKKLNEGLNNGDIVSIESDFDKNLEEGSYAMLLNFSDKVFSFIINEQPGFMTNYTIIEMHKIISNYLQNTNSKRY